MKHETSTRIVGLFLILGGLLFLLLNFGFLRELSGLLVALLFAAGGLVFLLVFLADREHWWALFPGFALLGISGLIGLGTLAPQIAGVLGGSLFLGSLSLSFWIVYFTHPEHWWAVIPGGVLLTLAGVAGVSNWVGGTVTGGLFFLGLALTFGLVFMLPTPQGRMAWAVWPAGACLAMGLLLVFSFSGLINVLWPVALIIGGAMLIYYNSRRHRSL